MVFEETVEISTPVEESSDESPAVSWAPVVAGAIAAAALTLVLLAFGAGMGFSAVSPWGNSGLSASTFEIGTGLYLIVVAMLASTIGGYVAGRLRPKWVGVHTHEVFFRDTAHGFLAWALATVPSAAGVSATQSAESGGPVDYYVDALLRSNPAASPNTTNLRAARREIARGCRKAGFGHHRPGKDCFGQRPKGSRQIVSVADRLAADRCLFRQGILTTGIREGDISALDRTYVAQVVAARTGLNQAGGYVRDNWNPSLTGR